MSNCLLPDLDYSDNSRNKRLSQARKVLGATIANRIIAYALFLFGAKREDIAKYLQVPHNTLLSFFTRVTKFGLCGFDDRRAKPAQQPGIIKNEWGCTINKGQLELHCGRDNKTINIPETNPLQLKALILTLLDNGLINRNEAAQALGFSCGNVDRLLRKMRADDVGGLIDGRQGQQQDYVFTPEIKSELILQYASNAAQGKPTSGAVLAGDLKERAQLDLSERSIRMHISKLGLNNKGEKLRAMVEKKTLGDS